VKVQPEQDPAAPLVIVRTLGAGDLPPGSLVILRARGPVRAWPQPGAS
jgi:hypothetical protein